MDFWWRIGAASAGASVLLNYVVSWVRDGIPTEEWQMATGSQLLHSVGIMPASGSETTRVAPVAARLMSAGLLMFSGSLYVQTLTNWDWLYFLFPMGVLAFAAGWGALALRM